MSRFFQNRPASGFRLDSPVKVPVASEMPRCAPPHTFRAGEEPEEGGGVSLGLAEPLISHAPERIEGMACLQV